MIFAQFQQNNNLTLPNGNLLTKLNFMEKFYQNKYSMSQIFDNIELALNYILTNKTFKFSSGNEPNLSYNLAARCESGKYIIDYKPALFINLDNIKSGTIAEMIKEYYISNKIIGITMPDQLLVYFNHTGNADATINYGFHSIKETLSSYTYNPAINEQSGSNERIVGYTKQSDFAKNSNEIWIEQYTVTNPPPFTKPPNGAPSPPPPFTSSSNGAPGPPPPPPPFTTPGGKLPTAKKKGPTKSSKNSEPFTFDESTFKKAASQLKPPTPKPIAVNPGQSSQGFSMQDILAQRGNLNKTPIKPQSAPIKSEPTIVDFRANLKPTGKDLAK